MREHYYRHFQLKETNVAQPTEEEIMTFDRNGDFVSSDETESIP